MFSPGETITQQFVIPFDISDVSYVIVSYKKNGSIILEKTITSGFLNYNNSKTLFKIEISQNDGLLFDDCDYYTMQVNVYTNGGSRHTSKEIRDRNGIQYFREVMGIGR